MRVTARLAREETSFVGKIIIITGPTKMLPALDIISLGTQRLYGKRGAVMVARFRTGELAVLHQCDNTRFAKIVRKHLSKNAAPPAGGVSIIWDDPSQWTAAIDQFVENNN